MWTRPMLDELHKEWEDAKFPPAQLLSTILKGPSEASTWFTLSTRHLDQLDDRGYEAITQALDLMSWPDHMRAIRIHDLTRHKTKALRAAKHVKADLHSRTDEQDQQHKDMLELLSHVPSITHLTLDMGNAKHLTGDVIDALPNTLTHFTLRFSEPLQESHIDRLSELQALESLHLESCIDDHTHITQLFDGAGLTQLRSLNLEGTRFTDNELELIATHQKTAALKELSLSLCQGTGQGFAALLYAEQLSGLERFHFRFMHIKPWVKAQGRPMHALHDVRDLDLNGLELTDDALLEIFNASCIPNLRRLNLQNNKMGVTSLGRLTERFGGEHAIEHLALQDNLLGNEGLTHLAQWQGLERLASFTTGKFRGEEDAGYEALLRSPWLQEQAITAAHSPSTARLNFAMALHPGVHAQIRSSFATQLPKKVWEQAAEHLGLGLKKSARREDFAARIVTHNAEHPAQALSLWEPPFSVHFRR